MCFFGRRIGINASRLDKLMKNPFVHWSTALRNFNDHQCKSAVHKTSLIMQTFVSVMEKERKPINQTQDQLLENTVSKNREIVSSSM